MKFQKTVGMNYPFILFFHTTLNDTICSVKLRVLSDGSSDQNIGIKEYLHSLGQTDPGITIRKPNGHGPFAPGLELIQNPLL